MAEETTTVVADSGSSEPSETPVTFENISSIDLEPADEGQQEAEKPSDTPPDKKAETVEEDAEQVEEEEVEADDEDEDDEPSDDKSVKADEAKPSNVNKFVWKDYRKLKAADEKVLNPLRDPSTTPEQKFQAIADYMPSAADEIGQAAAKASVDAYRDQWMAYLVGDEKATVESVKAGLKGTLEAPAAQAPAETTSKFESIADTPEAQRYIDYLDSIYGKDVWRDPENDDDLSVDDEDSVRVFRANLAIEAKRKADFDAMQTRLGELEPAVKSIEEGQKTEVENLIESTFQQDASAYEKQIEEYAVPAGLKAEGLLPEEGDSEEVKGVKEHLAGKFNPIAEGYPSPFADFVATKFSGREQLNLVIGRVQKYVRDAAVMKVQAKREKDPARAAQLKTQVATLNQHSDDERATLKVLAKKSVREFAATESAPYRKLLERIAILEGQTKSRLRTEVVGAAAGATGGSDEPITFDSLRNLEL